jgi:hypothetical protein
MNWAKPVDNYLTTNDSYVNSCIIEVSYYLQECPISSSNTQYTNYPITGTGFTSSVPSLVSGVPVNYDNA